MVMNMNHTVIISIDWVTIPLPPVLLNQLPSYLSSQRRWCLLLLSWIMTIIFLFIMLLLLFLHVFTHFTLRLLILYLLCIWIIHKRFILTLFGNERLIWFVILDLLVIPLIRWVWVVMLLVLWDFRKPVVFLNASRLHTCRNVYLIYCYCFS